MAGFGVEHVAHLVTNEEIQNMPNVDMTKWFQLARKIHDKPEEGVATMKTQTKWMGRLRTETQSSDNATVIRGDEPDFVGGDNTGPSPGKYFLHSLAQCFTVGYLTSASILGVKLDSLEILIEGEIDLQNFVGNHTSYGGFNGIEVKVLVGTDASSEYLRKMEQHVLAHCPLYDSIRNPVPVNVATIPSSDRESELEKFDAKPETASCCGTRAVCDLEDIISSGRLLQAQRSVLGAPSILGLDDAAKQIEEFKTAMGKIVDSTSKQGLRLSTATAAMDLSLSWVKRLEKLSHTTPNENCLKVFLGGSCNPTTWRADAAIPMLKGAGLSFFNPQVEDWSPECIDLENKAKDEAEVLLFVVDGLTRAIVSMNEVTELICRGRHTVLVVQDIAADTEIGGAMLSASELQDLNRGRAYLRDMAGRYGVPVKKDVVDGVEEVIRQLTATQ